MTRAGAAAACLLVVAGAGCGVSVFDAGPPPEVEAPTPFAIAAEDGDLLFNAADDEESSWPGIQVSLRVEVADPAIERVELAVASAHGDELLDDVVAEDGDGARVARFVVTLADAASTPVRAFSHDLPPESFVEAHAVLHRAD